jgi:DNA-binding beta-propeller fold protein YncE
MSDLMTNTTNYSGRCRGVAGALRGRLLVLLGAALALLICLPAVSQAATAVSSYAVGPQFGQDPPRGTTDPASTGVAVSQTSGNIFIAETNQNTVGIFAPDAGSGGTFLAIADFNSSGHSAVNLAVDPANDALYAGSSVYGNGISKEISDGAPTPTYSIDSGFAVPPGAIIAPSGMAVDPTTHDLLVVDNAVNRVFRLSSSTGAVISSFDGSDTTAGAFQAPGSIAVGPTGTIYVVDTAGARVERFSAAGTSLGTLSLRAGAQPASVTVNPQNGQVAVLLGLGDQSYLQGFTSSGTQTFTARVTAGVTAPGFGIAWDGTTNRIYASVGGGFARALLPATQPGVDPPAATPGRNTVHLTADVDPGGEDTTARFEPVAAWPRPHRPHHQRTDRRRPVAGLQRQLARAGRCHQHRVEHRHHLTDRRLRQPTADAWCHDRQRRIDHRVRGRAHRHDRHAGRSGDLSLRIRLDHQLR